MTRFYIVPVEDDDRNLDTRFVGQIRSFPELIHCRECAHRWDDNRCELQMNMIEVEDDYWCADGERKTE